MVLLQPRYLNVLKVKAKLKFKKKKEMREDGALQPLTAFLFIVH